MTAVARPAPGSLRAILARRRRAIAVSAAGGAAHQTCEVLVPVVIGAIVDRAIAPGDGSRLVLWLGVLAALFVALNLSFRLQFLVGMRAMTWSEHELRMSLCARILAPAGLRVGPPASGASGALVAIAGDDAQRSSAVGRAAAVFAGAVAAFAVAAIVMATISWWLALLAILGGPLAAWGLHSLAGPLQRRSADQQARAGEAVSVAVDLLAGARVLEGLGARVAATERYERVSSRSLTATLRAATMSSALAGATSLIAGGFVAGVALLAGSLAVRGTISIGDLIAATGVAQFLLGPMERVGWAAGVLARARASAARVDAVLAAPPATTGGTRPAPTQCAGAVHLASPRLDVAAGEHLGVVAEPAAASRLVEALALRDGTATGDYALDGVDLRSLDLAEARSRVLVSDHDADLFAGTLAENLDAIAAAGPEVLAAAAADEVLAAVPDGRDAAVGTGGRALSGGQRQRVALARALAADAPVLVLHEPTTAVDAVTEAAIADGIARLRARRTTVMLTTSPPLLEACDRVVMLRGGEPVLEGRHSELLSHPAYEELVGG